MRRLSTQPPPPRWFVVVLPAARALRVPGHCCDCDAPDAPHPLRLRIDRDRLARGQELAARGEVELRTCSRCRWRQRLHHALLVLLVGALFVFMLDGQYARRFSLPPPPRPLWFQLLAAGCLPASMASWALARPRLQAYSVGHTIVWVFRCEGYATRFARDNAPVLVGTSWQVMPSPPAGSGPRGDGS